jgi:hydroxymethylglutaryl-CoA lyase
VNFPERVTLVEVGPRDGLQSLPETYPLEVKVEMIETLARTGLEKIEVTAFVRPDVIPQLADAAEVLARVERFDGCTYRALVPNRRGAERAAAAGADEMVGLITASDTYNSKNQNMTVEENLTAVAAIAEVAQREHIQLVMAIGIAMFCPYEGEIPEERVLSMIERMRADGVEEFYLASSVGLDGPRKIYGLCSQILDRWPGMRLGLHLHNTNGMALANALAGLDAGVAVFEGSICGIGGGIRMPYGIAHYGNVATEDLAHMFFEMSIETGVDFPALLEAGRAIRELLGLETTFSYAGQGGTKEDVLERGRVAPRDR